MGAERQSVGRLGEPEAWVSEAMPSFRCLLILGQSPLRGREVVGSERRWMASVSRKEDDVCAGA